MKVEMRSALNRLGFALCVVTAAICLVLHIATFVTTISPVWVVPPVVPLAGSLLCSKAVEPRPRLRLCEDKVTFLGWVLLVYGVLIFIYFYKTTGGATSVDIVNGQYVSMYKDHVIRPISEEEYRMIPNLWTRFMSAWIGMMAVFCTRSFELPQIIRPGAAV